MQKTAMDGSINRICSHNFGFNALDFFLFINTLPNPPAVLLSYLHNKNRQYKYQYTGNQCRNSSERRELNCCMFFIIFLLLY